MGKRVEEYFRDNQENYDFHLVQDTFNLATNVLSGERWHDTAKVAVLLDKQVLMLRKFVEAQFPLPGGFTHKRIRDQATETHVLRYDDYGQEQDSINILPQEVLQQVGVAPLFAWDKPIVPYLEVAHEMRTEDAMQLVQSLFMRVMGMSNFAGAGFEHVSFRRERNLPVLQIIMSNAVKVAIYAKCVDRVRIETRYQESIKSILRSHIRPDASLQEIINPAIADSAKRLWKMFKALRNVPADPINKSRPLANFIKHVSFAFEHDPDRIQLFLNTCAVMGSVSRPIREDGSPYTYLLEQGILLPPAKPRLVNHDVQYQLADDYDWIVRDTIRARHFES